ncbi:MAG: arylesterase [Rhodocyclaceae bacterium]|nr:arylesterase [Rhodocyclaceae bacterium]
MLRLVLLLALFSPAAFAAETILIFGDSLSAGYGIGIEQSWPTLLAKRLEAEKLPYTVANASISGETTAGGASRLPAALARFKPAVVVIALGANDGLRGLPVAEMRANLQAMIRAARQHSARVLLVGIRLPPNYGPDYTAGFAAVYRQVAKQEKTALLPFLLEPIALDAAAFQADGLHPVAAAEPKILDHVWKALRPLLKRP